MDNGASEKPHIRRRKRGFSRTIGTKLAEIARARQRLKGPGFRQATEETLKVFCANCPKVVGASTLRYFVSADGRSDSSEHETIGIKEGAVQIFSRVYLCAACSRIPGLEETLRNPQPSYREENEIQSS